MLELTNGNQTLNMWEDASVNAGGLAKVCMTNKAHDKAIEIEVSGSNVEIPKCLLTQEYDLLIYGEKDGKLVVNTIPVLFTEKPHKFKTKSPDEFHWVEKNEKAVKVVKNINEGISGGTDTVYFDAWVNFNQYKDSAFDNNGMFTLYSDAKYADLKEKFDSGVSVVFKIEDRTDEMQYSLFYIPIIQYGYDKEEQTHYLVGSQIANIGPVQVIIAASDLVPNSQLNYFILYSFDSANSLEVVKDVNRARD